MEMIVREALIRTLSEENKTNRTAEFVISSEAVDTYRTVFRMDGWELERYNQNPIVAYAHRTGSDNPDMIIGTSEVRFENGQMIGSVRFEDADVNPLAEKVWRKIQSGTLRMASVGANPLEYRMGDKSKGEDPSVLYFTRTELLEWSVVPIGSNPDAQKRSVESIEEIRANLTKKTEPETVREDKGLSTFEAQLLINSNIL